MQNSFLRYALVAGLAVLALAVGTSAFAQGITTSAINGFVVDQSGKPVAAAAITVVNVPSGTQYTTQTRSNGQYNLSGLRVGGPYSVSVKGKRLLGHMVVAGNATWYGRGDEHDHDGERNRGGEENETTAA